MSTNREQDDRAVSRELGELLHVSHRTVLGWASDGYSLSAILASLGSSDAEHDRSWLSIASTAARFEVDEKTVRRWITNGDVVARRFGPKLIRVAVASVIDFSRPVGVFDRLL